jgi:hypothetical protein
MADMGRIFEVAMKGVTFVESLAQRGKDISIATVALKNIFSKRPEDVTDADLDEVEEGLDADLDEFEHPLNRKD